MKSPKSLSPEEKKCSCCCYMGCTGTNFKKSFLSLNINYSDNKALAAIMSHPLFMVIIATLPIEEQIAFQKFLIKYSKAEHALGWCLDPNCKYKN